MKHSKQKSGVIVGVLLPIGLTCLFAFCSLALALMGGRAYKQIQNSIDDSYGSTVASSYLRTKLLQNNTADSVSLRQQNNQQILVITSRTEQRDYEIRIYFADGILYESFVAADTPFEAIDGVEIAQASSCEFFLDQDGLFTAEIVSPEGAHTRTSFALLQGGGL